MGLNFSHIKGDTFDKVDFALIRNTLPLDLTNCTVRMQIKKECNGISILSFTTVESAGLTIIDAVGGLFKINKQIINIPEFNYIYDIEITFSNGDVKTWISGDFFVTCDVTR